MKRGCFKHDVCWKAVEVWRRWVLRGAPSRNSKGGVKTYDVGPGECIHERATQPVKS